MSNWNILKPIDEAENNPSYPRKTGKAPHRCPVCNGSGTVPADFYLKGNTANAGTVPCRSCCGTGIVWG